ncbi:hypothetical protein HO173_010758 [Letharia columbiana]|uniref:Transcription factor TFIIB cyclin-like domain-containing protein n=1 Tax=Letharia columbiana TaxID=112416 RepID=A0A8H6L0K3_9LECA|nr:uncharacterized protein HO173_010758 [Letharia columbiana]KAF6231058.1 hypothetical protein HO173_010758 [Letharia columbiana]
MASFATSETSLLDTSSFEKMIPSNGGSPLVVNQDLPEGLRAGYTEIKTLCEKMDTRLHIHSYARELFEAVYESEEFVSEPQKTVVAGCLFIAYEATEDDPVTREATGGYRILQESKISYHERSILAPAADLDVLRIFAALEEFLPKASVGDADEVMEPAVVNEAKGYNAALVENENPDDADSSVGDSTKFFRAAYKRIETLCECLPIPSQILCNVTARIKSLYKNVHLSGGFEQDEQAAVVAGCFYLAFRQLGVPRTFREVWIVTRVPIVDLEAVVKDLEEFFAEEARLEIQSEEEAEYLSDEPDTVSSSYRAHSSDDSEAEGPADEGRERLGPRWT